MAKAELTVTVRMGDLRPTKLLLWELQMLRDAMRVGADPFADRLDQIVERYIARLPDEGPDEEALP